MSRHRAGLGGVAAVAILSAAHAFAQDQAASESTVETIVVTAEKKSEALRDVPMAVSAISGAELTRNHDATFENYISHVPGMNLIEESPVDNLLVIRGVTTGTASINGSVATYVDETPWTSEGPFANTGIAANLDTYDLQRVEVLKGPQGTLYGALALGGLLKYVTNAPDPTGYAASIQIGGSTVDHGGTGDNFHAMLNIPLADDLAVRFVGYDSYYPGFIDDPTRGLTDVNGSHVAGGRVSLLYEPTDNFSIRLNLLYQDITSSDTSTVDVNPGSLTPIYGKLADGRLISSPEQTKNELINATVNWGIGFADLVSSTSYSYTPINLLLDQTGFDGGIIPGDGAALLETEPVTNYTQEIRLSSPAGSNPLQWQVGGYYNHELAREFEQLFAVDPATHQVLYNFPTVLDAFTIKATYQEFATFANLDYFILPDFDVAFGGRYSSNSQSYHQLSTGTLVGVSDFTNKSSQDVFTYSGDARWHWTPDTMLYARIATGYVPGGPNDGLPGSTLPVFYNSSTTTNYELGAKGQFFDRKVSADVALFHIDWTNIQVAALVGDLFGITNGGNAQSDGVEWNLGYVPLPGLRLNFNGAYTDARLDQPLPAPTIGPAGAMLPYVPLWSTNLSADYERPLFGDYSGFAGVTWHYTGPRYADFQSGVGPNQRLPGYDMVDLKAGLDSARYALTLYVKNAGNTIAYSTLEANSLNGGEGAQVATVLTPRTIGIDLSAKF